MARQEFPIAAPGKFAQLFPVFIGGVVPLAVAAALAIAAHGRTEWLVAVPALLIMPFVGGVLAWSMHHKRVAIDAGQLLLRIFPFPKRLAITELDLAQARVVDLEGERGLQPVLKLMGTGLPGYRTGWFRLRDGRKAWLALTDWRRVLVLPRRDGGVVLLSPERPDALLDALRRVGG